MAGATGHLGRHVVVEAVRRGHRVVALSRTLRGSDGAEELIAADATDPAQLIGCCDEIDVVISAIGVVGTAPRGTSYDDIDHLANTNLLREAERSGVRRFVFTSVFAPGGEKLRVVRAKRRFEQELAESRLTHTVIRPNASFSDLENFLSMALRGRAFVVGSGDQRMNPIHGADLATVVVDHLDGGDQLVSVGGPEVLSHNEIVEVAFGAAERTPRTTHVPVGVARALLATLPRVTPERTHGPAEFLLSMLSRDMVAPSVGTRTLADHFRDVVSSRSNR